MAERVKRQADCAFMPDCPALSGPASERLKEVWTSWYCRGHKQESCAVRHLLNQGKQVPADLTPSGRPLQPVDAEKLKDLRKV